MITVIAIEIIFSVREALLSIWEIHQSAEKAQQTSQHRRLPLKPQPGDESGPFSIEKSPFYRYSNNPRDIWTNELDSFIGIV